MRSLVTIGVILVLLGILGFVVPRITIREQRTVLDVGPVEVEAEQQRSVPIPDIAAGVAVVAGLVLVVVGSSSNRT